VVTFKRGKHRRIRVTKNFCWTWEKKRG